MLNSKSTSWHLFHHELRKNCSLLKKQVNISKQTRTTELRFLPVDSCAYPMVRHQEHWNLSRNGSTCPVKTRWSNSSNSLHAIHWPTSESNTRIDDIPKSIKMPFTPWLSKFSSILPSKDFMCLNFSNACKLSAPPSPWEAPQSEPAPSRRLLGQCPVPHTAATRRAFV